MYIVICLNAFFAFNLFAEPSELSDDESHSILNDIDFTNYLSFYSAYRFNKHRFRRARVEGRNKAKGVLSEEYGFSTDLRARAEGVLLGKESKYTKNVEKDESLEMDVMNAVLYADLDFVLCDIGIQQIDWTNSLSPNTVDILTPIDIRHGGWGSPDEIIVPVPAIKTYFTKINLEWLLIPLPQSNRIPRGENEYGFFENLTENFGTEATISEEKIPSTLENIESGLRIKHSFEKVEANLLYFKSHRRNPSSFISFESNGFMDHVILKYPSQNILGGGLTYAGDDGVVRFYSYFEPNRFSTLQLEQVYLNNVPLQLTPQKEERLHIGLGVDYILSEKIKLYSDSIFTSSKLIKNENHNFINSKLNRTFNRSEDLFQSSIHLEFQSFNSSSFYLKTTFLFPYFAYALTPEIDYTYDNWKAHLGAHLITTKNEKSKFEPFKDNNQIYSKISYYF